MKQTAKFDSKLSEISGLSWLPWVGNEYDQNADAAKLLIIGESHYHDEDEDWYKTDPEATRLFISQIQHTSISTYLNVNRLLTNGKMDESLTECWEHAAYLNICQRAVPKGEQPTNEDFEIG